MISGSGVNLEEHPPMPYPKEDTVRFVSVMRIMKDKGIEELLEAARRIHEKHPGNGIRAAGRLRGRNAGTL